MSLFAVPGFCLAAVYAGFSMAFLISSMTVQAGLMGVFLFLLSVFPVSYTHLDVYKRQISKRIQEELQYPGQIKVNVIRESRVTDYAK